MDVQLEKICRQLAILTHFLQSRVGRGQVIDLGTAKNNAEGPDWSDGTKLSELNIGVIAT